MVEVVIIAACAAAAVALVWILLRRSMVRAVDSVEEAIDAMISGDVIPGDYGDTLSSRLHAKLRRLGDVMAARAGRQGEEHARVQELISDISHQVKTPMANIKMLNETLAKPGIEPEKREQLAARLSSQIEKLDFLMRALIKTSRLEAGVIVPRPEPLPVMETLAQAVSAAAPPAEARQTEITVDCPDGVIAMHDRRWTAEALFNILDNAVKYTPVGGNILIDCEQWEIYTRIRISDDGPGIPEAEQAQVFGRFYRSPATASEEGVGVGLYLAREIIQRQGGYIELKSGPDGGASFSVFLPNA